MHEDAYLCLIVPFWQRATVDGRPSWSVLGGRGNGSDDQSTDGERRNDEKRQTEDHRHNYSIRMMRSKGGDSLHLLIFEPTVIVIVS